MTKCIISSLIFDAPIILEIEKIIPIENLIKRCYEYTKKLEKAGITVRDILNWQFDESTYPKDVPLLIYRPINPQKVSHYINQSNCYIKKLPSIKDLMFDNVAVAGNYHIKNDIKKKQKKKFVVTKRGAKDFFNMLICTNIRLIKCINFDYRLKNKNYRSNYIYFAYNIFEDEFIETVHMEQYLKNDNFKTYYYDYVLSNKLKIYNFMYTWAPLLLQRVAIINNALPYIPNRYISDFNNNRTFKYTHAFTPDYTSYAKWYYQSKNIYLMNVINPKVIHPYITKFKFILYDYDWNLLSQIYKILWIK